MTRRQPAYGLDPALRASAYDRVVRRVALVNALGSLALAAALTLHSERPAGLLHAGMIALGYAIANVAVARSRLPSAFRGWFDVVAGPVASTAMLAVADALWSPFLGVFVVGVILSTYADPRAGAVRLGMCITAFCLATLWVGPGAAQRPSAISNLADPHTGHWMRMWAYAAFLVIVYAAALGGRRGVVIEANTWVLEQLARLSSELGLARPPAGRLVERAAEVVDLRRSIEARVRSLSAAGDRASRTAALLRENLHGIGHDLRLPLTSLRIQLDSLAGPTGDDPRLRRAQIAIARKEAERLTMMIGQLLELARLESPEFPFAPEPFDPRDLTLDIFQRFSPHAEQLGKRLVADVAPGAPAHCVGELGLIERALQNLIENAIRHAAAATTIELWLEARADGCAFVVRNRLSDTSEADSSARPVGLGLGLVIARRIAALHGGTLTLDVSQPGQALATLWLPGGARPDEARSSG